MKIATSYTLGEMSIDEQFLSVALVGAAGVKQVQWDTDKGFFTDSNNHATPFADPSPYQGDVNAWLTAAQTATPPITLAHAQAIKSNFIDAIYNAKRKALTVSFAPTQFATTRSAVAPGLGNNMTWSVSPNDLVVTVTTATGVGTGLATNSTTLGSGKLYWEMGFTSLYSGGPYADIGIIPVGSTLTAINSIGSGSGYSYSDGGNKNHSGGGAAYGDSYAVGDIISVAFDSVHGNLWFAKNGVWQNGATAAEIAAGITTHAAYTGITGSYNAAVGGLFSSGSDAAQFWPAGFNYSSPAGYVAPSGTGTPMVFGGDDVSVQNVNIIASGGAGGTVPDVAGTAHALNNNGVIQLATLLAPPRSALNVSRNTLQANLAALSTIAAVIAFDVTAGWP